MAQQFPSLDHTPRAFPLPTISEDTLHYTLHIPPSSDPAATALLVTQHVQSLLPQPWLWNKDGWELKVVSAESQAAVGSRDTQVLGGKLEGTMRVGDAVDDEWLVVWLLREVSRKWPDFVIGVQDSDGQFLLIEAASELPKWVAPENADNRLWLQDGHLHLIPLSVKSAVSSRPKQIPDDDEVERQHDPESYLSEKDAVKAVRTGSYRAEANMEQAVWNRISCYPDALNTHQHKTKAHVPVAVAKVLRRHPELIQRATEGFYVRDPSQLRAAARMTHFPPSPSVLVPVTLTRAAYAQLQGQVFHPPRVFGPEWHVREGAELDNERRWRDLGVKIATGFEIMYREGGKKGRSGTDGEHEGVRSEEGYKSFLQSLKKAGWFGEELEGSEKWKERELEALKGYQGVKAADTTSQRPSFAYLVDSALESSSHITPEDLKVSPSAPEDSESWLEISPDELDAMMMRTSGRTTGQTNQSGDTQRNIEDGDEQGQALQDLAKKVEEFVGGQGDMTGARFMDELSDDDMDDSEEDDEEAEANERKALEAEKETRLRNLVPALPAEEWGRRTQTATSPAEDDTTMPGPKPRAKREKTKLDPIDALKAKSRPPVFAKQEYDGVVDDSESDSESDSDLPPAGTLGRIVSQMKWGEGESKNATIEEIDDEDDRKQGLSLGDGDNLDDEMQRRVWGGGDEDEEEEEDDDGQEGEEEMDFDVDMEAEGEEFLQFARNALGIPDEMWENILGDRRARGAFVPGASTSSNASKPTAVKSVPDTLTSEPEVKPLVQPKAKKGVSFAPNAHVRMYHQPETPDKAASSANTSLDSFENVMRAMNEELSRSRLRGEAMEQSSLDLEQHARSVGQSNPSLKSKLDRLKGERPTSSSAEPLPKLPTEADLEAMDEDDLLAMDRELREALKGAGIEDVDDDMGIDEVGELDEGGRSEYEMMKSFLESYQSQGGGSGVVGNLFGRLGEKSS